MDNVIFLTYHKGIQGSYLNHLDLSSYLKKQNYNIKFYCENVKKLFEVIKLSRRQYKFDKGEVKKIKKNLVLFDTVITDFKTILSLHIENYFIICKKLLIFDSVELTYHLKDMKQARFYYDIQLRNVLRNFYSEDIIFFMPPSNHKLFREKYPDLNSEIYFKTINIDVLDTIQYKNKDEFFYRWDTTEEHIRELKNIFGSKCVSFIPEWILKNNRRVPLKYNESSFIFDYKNLIYRRRKYLEYQEQFGRLIFEYILLGKTVYFLNKHRTNDCLTDYLNHYNIQFENNKIITTKEELKERMLLYQDLKIVEGFI